MEMVEKCRILVGFLGLLITFVSVCFFGELCEKYGAFCKVGFTKCIFM